MADFFQFGLTGLLSGVIYALVAMGFVLIYKASRVFNFAMGELLLLGAYMSFTLIGTLHLPVPLAILLSIGFSIILGLVVERFSIRPLIGQPLLALIMEKTILKISVMVLIKQN